MSKSLKSNQSFNFDTSLYSTSDMGCAAALMSCQHKLTHLDRSNPRKVLFIFLKKERIEEIANAYFSDTLTVKARRYFDSIKALKSRLYSEGQC